MSTLPLISAKTSWAQARDIHSERFTRPIGEVLDLVATCPNGNVWQRVLGWFLTDDQDGTIVRAMMSDRGRRYLELIAAAHQKSSLVVASPQAQFNLVARVLSMAGQEFYNRDSVFGQCNKFLSRLFDYDQFVDGALIKRPSKTNLSYRWGKDNSLVKWNTAELIKRTRIKYCPYCNAETIYVVTKNGESEYYKSPLDHFLPKSRYPFFALTLTNLIPACGRCNTNYKLDKDPLSLWAVKVNPNSGDDIEIFRTAHPYIEDVYENFETRFGLVNGELKLIYHVLENDSLARSKTLMENLFRWSETYSELFLGEAARIATNITRVRPMYKKMIKSAFGLTVNLNLDRLICGFDTRTEDFMNHRHGKLKLDLFNRYGGECR